MRRRPWHWPRLGFSASVERSPSAGLTTLSLSEVSNLYLVVVGKPLRMETSESTYEPATTR